MLSARALQIWAPSMDCPNLQMLDLDPVRCTEKVKRKCTSLLEVGHCVGVQKKEGLFCCVGSSIRLCLPQCWCRRCSTMDSWRG